MLVSPATSVGGVLVSPATVVGAGAGAWVSDGAWVPGVGAGA